MVYQQCLLWDQGDSCSCRVVSKYLKEEAGSDVGLEGCIRVIQPRGEILKPHHMDEELKKQSCVEYREGVNLMKMGYWEKIV